jgi:hypothetical protein
VAQSLLPDADDDAPLAAAVVDEVFSDVDEVDSLELDELFASPLLDEDELLSLLARDSEPSLTVDVLDLRESFTYQPEPLKTMPTGWMILRKAPPQASHVVSGASEKLCRFSIIALQDVHV